MTQIIKVLANKSSSLLRRTAGVLRRTAGVIGPGSGSLPGNNDEKLTEAHEKLAEKNRRLKRLRQRLARQEEEISRLQAELTRAQSVRRLPSFFDRDVPVFFVTGAGKSGTTWLRSILDAHPEILCRGEGRLFERDFKQAARHQDLKQERVKYLQPSSLYSAISSSEHLKIWIKRSVWTGGKNVDNHVDSLARLAINYFLTERLSKTGKRIVGDKTPFASAKIIGEIGTIYPEAKVIHIIRDGRDVAVSMIHHMWNYAKSEGGIYPLEPEELERREAYRKNPLSPLAEGLFTEDRLTSIAAQWSTEVGKAIEDGPDLLGDNYAEVRYEDLLERPTEELGRLLEFLGADADIETAKECIETTSFETKTKGRKRGEEDSAAFVRKGVAGDWKNVFTEEDRRVFKEVAGDLLIKLGYERDLDW